MERLAIRTDSSVSISQTDIVHRSASEESPPVLRLRLKKPKADKRVGWRDDTVDNENMDKKKSKCCCIYKKTRAFGESSSDEDEECEHCFGHPEKKKKNLTHEGSKSDSCETGDNASCSKRLET